MNPSSVHSNHFDLVIIGGGTAGLAAVMEAIDLQVPSIALIEKNKLGGECAFFGCVPTKTMLKAVRYLKSIRQDAGEYGVTATKVEFDFKKLMHKVDAVIAYGDYDFLNHPNVSVLEGEASFISHNQLELNGKTITFKKLIIATGAGPSIPNIEGLESSGYLTYQQATHLKTLPDSLAIIGAGPVGVEFSYIFQGLGTQVSLIETKDDILKKEEPEIQQAVLKLLEKQGVKIYTACEIKKIGVPAITDHSVSGQKQLTLVLDNQKEIIIDTDNILIATGVRPRFAGLCLEKGGIQYHDRGIEVNQALETSNPNVWAIGDSVGPYRFTHVADYHAGVAVRNAIRNVDETVDYHAIPWAIFTDPSVGHVGLTEAEALKEYDDVQTVIIQAEAVSRYRIDTETEGFIKLVIDGQTEEVIGAHIFAVEAEELAQTVCLAIQNRMTTHELLNMIYIYPARAQLIQKALESYLSESASKGEPLAI